VQTTSSCVTGCRHFYTEIQIELRRHLSVSVIEAAGTIQNMIMDFLAQFRQP
jgi:hypothetical protein